jgi:hypothetical protein
VTKSTPGLLFANTYTYFLSSLVTTLSRTVGAFNTMPNVIAAVFIALWLLGLLTSTTMGGVIHVLLIVGVVMVLLHVISGQGLH